MNTPKQKLQYCPKCKQAKENVTTVFIKDLMGKKKMTVDSHCEDCNE